MHPRNPAFLVVALLLLLGGQGAVSAPGVAVYVDWVDGNFRAGLGLVGVGEVDDGEPVPRAGVGPVNLERFQVPVNPCHRRLFLDLLYAPENATADGGAASVALVYEFRAELFDANGTRLASVRVTGPAHGYALGTVPAAGAYRLDLYLLVGAEVDWSLRVRGRPVHGEPACEDHVLVSEMESNPLGGDAGNEWLELHNAGIFPVDLSGWRVRATHGVPQESTLPAGTTLQPGDRLVVAFPEQFLDNEAEVVVLEDANGRERDRTPELWDSANDGRSWQRVGDASDVWAFADATLGAPNVDA